MDLRSSQSFWPIQDGLIATYPPLESNESCDVLVTGAGITGALVADRLARSGLNVIVLDRRDVAHGSTAASTALLQYEIDTPLVALREQVPPGHADRAYLLGVEAIRTLAQRCAELADSSGFRPAQSLYLAHNNRAADRLQREAEARQAIGIDARYLDADSVYTRCGIPCAGAIVSAVAATVNPYRLTHALLADAVQRGVRVYDQTEVRGRRADREGLVVTTDRDFTVRCRHMVYATGYEAQGLLKQKDVALTSTFAIATEPIRDLGAFGDAAILWTTEAPYFYARTTADHRVIAGGADVRFRNPPARDRLVERKAGQIEAQLRRWLPGLRFERRYAWAGTFSSTRDGLAYIGAHPEHPCCFFALGYGGNGITYSVIAAQMLNDLIHGRLNADADIFRFERHGT